MPGSRDGVESRSYCCVWDGGGGGLAVMASGGGGTGGGGVRGGVGDGERGWHVCVGGPRVHGTVVRVTTKKIQEKMNKRDRKGERRWTM
jgi:hypothetical protein